MGLEVQCDSSLIVNQVIRKYVARDSRMAEYLQLILRLKSKVPRCDFRWVPRSENNHADSLTNLGAATEFQFRHEISSSTSPIRASSNQPERPYA